MDNAIEQIRIMKDSCEIHLLVEVSPDSIKSNIIDFSLAPLKSGVHSFASILPADIIARLDPYLYNVSTISYAYYPSKKLFSIRNIKTGFQILKLLKARKISLVHFDTTSSRFFPFLPFLFGYSLCATVHDPVPHTGEQSLKKVVIDNVYRKIINRYLIFSKFAKNQFKGKHKSLNRPIYEAKLLPYTYIKSLRNTSIDVSDYLLFFGRISYYKGIDLFIDALEVIWIKYPGLKVLIAGKPHGNIEIKLPDSKYNANITYFLQHLSIDQLHNLIANSKFVVCPYREATQSGVLMTAFAMKKPVLATNVGSFPEYIQSHINGLLVEPNAIAISKGIDYMLTDNYYQEIENKLKRQSTIADEKGNLIAFRKMYGIDS